MKRAAVRGGPGRREPECEERTAAGADAPGILDTHLPRLGEPAVAPRVSRRGKFLFAGEQKLFVRGATYGAFEPDVEGSEFPPLRIVGRDFAQMAANGLNAVRVFTPPPAGLLDVAQTHGLRVMVGLAAEKSIAALVEKKAAEEVEHELRMRVRSCAGHPALLCYAVGNELSASMVRWLGGERVERGLERLVRIVRSEHPEGLVTYANYPSTEYLRLLFLDLVCFNVYLESQDRFEAYLGRLQNLAGDRPLLMGEIGVDSRSHGEDGQARVLDWQVRTAFAAGCAGVFVFAWTDDWYTGGAEVGGWDFGLTTRDRRPKPARGVVREAFEQVPFPATLEWPRISVIVCSRNGARTLRECAGGLTRLEYPDFEVILVDDGSSDETPAIGREYGFRVITIDGCGLGVARNTGLDASTGEIVAYIDDDAYPDPHWLTYLAATFLRTRHAGVGGPNLPPPDDGHVAACVAAAPGGPMHVLLSDTEAEHLPGCNVAFRKDALRAIGGFDPRFQVAGDDVDVCWRLREEGSTLGFSPAAVVWHHRRNSVRAYWRQQCGYGRAEALLERKWPEKYNAAGHVRWSGRIYMGRRSMRMLGGRRRIYHGTWGSAPFQLHHQPAPRLVWSLPALPDWYFLGVAVAALCALGALWSPLLFAVPALGLAALAPLVHAWLSSASASTGSLPQTRVVRVRLRALAALLHLLHPIARLSGRLRAGLVPWRRHCAIHVAVPRRRTSAIWSGCWQTPDTRLRSVEASLRKGGAAVVRGGATDRWDLEVRGGWLASVRLIMGIEDYVQGEQLVRFRWWARCAPAAIWPAAAFAALAAGAGLNGAWAACAVLGAVPVVLAISAFVECTAAMGAVARALESHR